MPEGVRDGIVKGMYLLREGPSGKLRVQLLGSGAILREVIAAADLLEQDWDIAADIWSVTSFNELRREGLDIHRANLMQPEQAPQLSYVEQCLGLRQGPVVAATDYMRAYADQIRSFVPHRYAVLGTDGYGRSDTREKLREFFEVDRRYVVAAALKALADEGEIPAERVREAFSKYEIDTKKPNPVSI
jgi:pyruvate dehydrogenase E1 component